MARGCAVLQGQGRAGAGSLPSLLPVAGQSCSHRGKTTARRGARFVVVSRDVPGHLPPCNVRGHGARLGLTGSGSTKCSGSADPHISWLQRGLASPSHHACPPPQHCAMPRGHPCTEQSPSSGPDPGGPSQEDLQLLAVTRCHRGAAFWALLRCSRLLCAGREAVL